MSAFATDCMQLKTIRLCISLFLELDIHVFAGRKKPSQTVHFIMNKAYVSRNQIKLHLRKSGFLSTIYTSYAYTVTCSINWVYVGIQGMNWVTEKIITQ